jgi:hypothetical protein
MLRTGAILTATLAALGSAYALSHSQPQQQASAPTAALTKVDFDRAFADLSTIQVDPAIKGAERDLLRVGAMGRFLPAAAPVTVNVVKTTAASPGPVWPLINVDTTLRTTHLGNGDLFSSLTSSATSYASTRMSQTFANGPASSN